VRLRYQEQPRLDCPEVSRVVLNLKCRDEIIPILQALQHVYEDAPSRRQLLDSVGKDVCGGCSRKLGRKGLDYWSITVLAAVRLGCNLDYDKLQNLAEEHRTLRLMMGIGDWDEDTSFNWRRIHDNVCLLQPATIDALSQALVAEGHRTEPEAAKKVRGDSFVAETNIHWPTESSLIRDGLRKILVLGLTLAAAIGQRGWRQHAHLLTKANRLARDIDRLAAKKGPHYEQRLKPKYRELLKLSGKLTQRARRLAAAAGSHGDAATLDEWTRGAAPLDDDHPGRILARVPADEHGDPTYRTWMSPRDLRGRFEASTFVRDIWPPELRRRSADRAQDGQFARALRHQSR